MKKVKLEHARCDMEQIDLWPPGALTALHRASYDALARLGTIRPLSVRTDPHTGQTAVKYLSAIPHEWTLQALGELKREGAQIEIKEL